MRTNINTKEKFTEFDTIRDKTGITFKNGIYDTIDLIVYFLALKANPQAEKPKAYVSVTEFADKSYNLSKQAMSYRAKTKTPYIYLSGGNYNQDKLNILLLKILKNDLQSNNKL